MKLKTIVAVAAVLLLIFPIAFKLFSAQTSGFHPIKTPKRGIKIALVGDSITESSEYPSDLQNMLGENYSVGNFGSWGSTVSLNSWKPYMTQPQFHDALNFTPDAVVILLGTNDDLATARRYNETFEEDYTTLITSFQRLDSHPQVWIANSPPIYNDSADLNPQYLTNTIIPDTKNVANNLNLPLIDVYTAFGNHTDYYNNDLIHPNSAGSAVIASTVYDAISTLDNQAYLPDPPDFIWVQPLW